MAARSYDLHSDNGTISLDGASGPVKIGSGFGDITVTHGQGVTLDVTTSNGEIGFSGSLADGPHTITSGFGDVTLSLPADLALYVELKTGFGQVQTEFPLTVTGAADCGHLTGTLNGGGPSSR